MRGSALLLVALLTGCSGALESARAPVPTPSLPPDDADAVAALYERELDAMGVRLTRAGLVDRTDGKFEYSPQGTHLALYVEPVGPATTADYVDRIYSVTRIFASTIFERWSGLETFDVCQEPPPGDDDSPEPPPVTQVTMRRDAAAEVDWKTASLTELLIMAKDTRENENGIPKVLVSTNAEITEHPAFMSARRTANRTAKET